MDKEDRMTRIQEIQFRQICGSCRGMGQLVTNRWEEYIGNVYVVSTCTACGGSGRKSLKETADG